MFVLSHTKWTAPRPDESMKMMVMDDDGDDNNEDTS